MPKNVAALKNSEPATERELLEVPDTRKGMFDIVAQSREDRRVVVGDCEQKRELLCSSSDFVDDPSVPPLI